MNENDFEDGCIQIFKSLGYDYKDTCSKSLKQVVLKEDFIDSLKNINPHCTEKELEQAYTLFTNEKTGEIKQENKRKYKLIVEENVVINTDKNNSKTVKLIDFDTPMNNSFSITQQYKTKYKSNPIRKPDLVVLVNGIPIGICELKDSKLSAESLKDGYNQLTNTYVNDIPNLFYYNQINCVMNPQKARVGSYTADWNWYLPWRYIESESEPVNENNLEYETMIKGVFNKTRILDIIKNYVLYDSNNNKITPTYYQYYGVDKAVINALDLLHIESSMNPSARQIGMIVHSQGSGKSISISDFIKNISNKSSNMPLFVVLTDTNDLDIQLSQDVLENFGIENTHVNSIQELRNEIKKHTSSGGIITSTIHKFDSIDDIKSTQSTINHIKLVYNLISSSSISENKLKQYREEISNLIELKHENLYKEAKDKAQNIKIDMINSYGKEINKNVSFFDIKDKLSSTNYYTIDDEYSHPVLNERSDIIIISDEAHRSQDKNYGRNVRNALPNASQIGFTATPLYAKNETTMDWFGEEISTYKIDEAQRDGAILKLDYENRAPKLNIDTEILEEEYNKKEGILKSNNIQYRKFIKSEKRQHKVAEDILYKFENRQQIFEGNAMIVVNGRDTAYKYEQIINNYDLDFETIAVVSNRQEFTDKYINVNLKEKFKNKDDDFKLAIVDRKWTVGFNCVQTHTVFLDAPMDSHNIIQTTGRINRLAKGKNSALVVDYVGMSNLIKNAYYKYTSNYDRDSIDLDFEEKINKYEDKIELLKNSIEYSNYNNYSYLNSNEKNKILLNIEKEMSLENKKEFISEYDKLDNLYGIIHPCPETERNKKYMNLFTELYGRLLVRLDRKYNSDNKTNITSDIIQESIDSEKAIQIDYIESDFAKNISNPDIDLPRITNGVINKMEKDDSYDEITKEEFKEELNKELNKYNKDRTKGTVAAQNIKNKTEDILNKGEKAKELGITTNQLEIYNIISENTNKDIDKSQLINCVQNIDESIIESTYIDWKERDEIKDKINYDIMDILENQLNIMSISLTDKIMEKTEHIY